MPTRGPWYSQRAIATKYHNNTLCIEGNNIEDRNLVRGTGQAAPVQTLRRAQRSRQIASDARAGDQREHLVGHVGGQERRHLAGRVVLRRDLDDVERAEVEAVQRAHEVERLG